jgi:pyruvate/2-oxoglutarate dehydrogenase complex dihydrolipoamide acyltransferase (E2) component
MPALSPTMEEGTLAKWHIKAGDQVRSGDVIAEIETDKATMEVEAVDEGTVEAILVPEGSENVKVNTPIARLAGEGEAAAPATSEARKDAPGSRQAEGRRRGRRPRHAEAGVARSRPAGRRQPRESDGPRRPA